MSINATVTLSIGELDGLRDKIKSLQTDINGYKERERTVTVKVIETSFRNHTIPIYQEVYPRGIGVETVQHPIEVESYKNIDDIMDALRVTAKQEVEKSLTEAHYEIGDKNVKIDSLTKQLKDKTEELAAVKRNKEHGTLQENLQKAQEKVQSLMDNIRRDAESYGDKLSSLYDEIDRLNSRKWYQILFKGNKA